MEFYLFGSNFDENFFFSIVVVVAGGGDDGFIEIRPVCLLVNILSMSKTDLEIIILIVCLLLVVGSRE